MAQYITFGSICAIFLIYIIVHFLQKNKDIILYGISLSILLFLLKWLELRLLIINHTFEIYIGIIAFSFTLLGIWLAKKLTKPKVVTQFVEKQDFVFNEKEGQKLEISKREIEVLALMSEGLSNQEIAEKLFVSLNTIKTHSSNIFEKLDVKRRTQAIEKAKRLSLIP